MAVIYKALQMFAKTVNFLTDDKHYQHT